MCDHVHSQEIHLIYKDGLIIFMLHVEFYGEKKLLKSSYNKKTSIEMRNLKIAKLCGNSNNHQLFFQLP